MSLFRLFQVLLLEMERYVFEPLFYLLVFMFYGGIGAIRDGKNNRLYSTRKEKIIGGASLVILSIIYFWWYWVRTYSKGLINV
jgi:hypothetical protein